MQLTRAGDYAIRALIYMACQPDGRVVNIVEISRERGVPPGFLSKIFQSLVKAGIVVSHQGSKGGFTLARPPEKITMREIVEVMEGPIAFNKCLQRDGVCSLMEVCSARKIWKKAQEQFLETLEEANLAMLSRDLLRSEALRK